MSINLRLCKGLFAAFLTTSQPSFEWLNNLKILPVSVTGFWGYKKLNMQEIGIIYIAEY